MKQTHQEDLRPIRDVALPRRDEILAGLAMGGALVLALWLGNAV